MGKEAIYKCKNCSNKFKAREGGGFKFFEYRCVDCDTIKTVETMDQRVPPDQFIPPAKEEIGVCKKCGGELKVDIRPMCPKCKSRDVEENQILTQYD